MWFLKQQQVFAMIWKCCPHACLASGFLFGFLLSSSCCWYISARKCLCCLLPKQKLHTPKCPTDTNMTEFESYTPLWDASRHIGLLDVCCHRCIRLTHADTQSQGQHIKRHHRWHSLPLTPKEDMSYPTACLSVPTSRIPLCQTAAEQIIQSVSSPWWPDLPHTRTSPGCGSEEDWDIHRLLALIISPPEPTADILFRVLIRWTVNVNDADICGCLRHHEARTMLDKGYVNTLAVYFWSESVFRGICSRDIDASSIFSHHPFEQRPTLPFSIPPALNKAVCPQKQTTPRHGEGRHAGQSEKRAHINSRGRNEIKTVLSRSHLSRHPLTTSTYGWGSRGGEEAYAQDFRWVPFI